ncbi:MAG TPA: cysteine desulfurase family protein [Candidatus Paceibacterota bacterium]|nr:cysteine desulfurase family protein [Candidatus Paceibacterota bacterium]
MSSKIIYLDNAATTKVDDKVIKEMLPFFSERYGNASSIHKKGIEAKETLEKSRKIIADSINALPEEILFTSGGTESNNLAIKGLALQDLNKKHIITTKIEHDCILNTCKLLEQQGYKITYLDVDEKGFADLNQLKNSITTNTLLVSVIHGNNEIGTIQDIESIGKICQEKNVYFHTDACQSYTKTEIDVKKQNISLMSLNAHKIHGPKGVGALFIKKGIKLTPIQHGGGQEKNKRSGTENIPGIVGFAKSVVIAQKNKKSIKEITKMRDYLINKILEIKGTQLNGPLGTKRICNNVNVSFSGIEGESIVIMLSEKGICVSTGSACSSKNLDPSHVIMALENNSERAHGSIRFTISKYTKKSDIDYTIKELNSAVNRLRKFSPLTHKLN